MENSEEKLLNLININIQQYALQQNIEVEYTLENVIEIVLNMFTLNIKINISEKKVSIASGVAFPHEKLNYCITQVFANQNDLLKYIQLLFDISENRIVTTQWFISQFLIKRLQSFSTQKVDNTSMQGIIYVNICFDKDNFTYEITILEEQTEVRVFDKNEDYYFSTVEPTLVSTKVDDVLAFLSSLF